MTLNIFNIDDPRGNALSSGRLLVCSTKMAHTMKDRRFSFHVAPENAGARLDQFLAEALLKVTGEPLSRAKIRKLIVAGKVFVNFRMTRIATLTLNANAQVDLSVDFARLQNDGRAQDRRFTMDAQNILYEDEFLLAVNKPPGLPAQPTVDAARENLFDIVRAFLARRDNNSEPYLGVHQRLDRDTSGVVLFTKAPAANAKLAEAFSNHQLTKVYQALTVRPAQALTSREWSVSNHLVRVASSKGKQGKYAATRAGGSFAHTDFSLIEDLGSALRLAARPRTGRTHQIRVHLAEAGLPILGDLLYGNKQWKNPANITVPRLMLHAAALTFRHPITDQELVIESSLPADFQQLLAALKSSKRK
jgi:RluA family pseudouridine synthase